MLDSHFLSLIVQYYGVLDTVTHGINYEEI